MTKQVPAGGLDLEMPGPARWMAEEHVQKALDNGTLTRKRSTTKSAAAGRARKGWSVRQSRAPTRTGENKPEHRKIIREAAREAIVLLKNEETPPLKKTKSIAVIGPYARTAQMLGGGSSCVTPHYRPHRSMGSASVLAKVKVETAPGT